MKIPNLRAKFKPKGCKGNIHFGKVFIVLMLISLMVLRSMKPVRAVGDLYYYDKYSVKEVWSEEKYDGATGYYHGEPYITKSKPRWDGERYVYVGEVANYNTGYHIRHDSEYWYIYDYNPYGSGGKGTSYYNRYYREREKIKGQTLIVSNIKAPIGYYPDNGEQGGYWYVRKGLVNKSPTLTLSTPTQNSYFGKDKPINVSGTVKDTDSRDILTIKYTISGITAHTNKTLRTITANGSNQNYNKNITIDTSIPQGNYTIKVWVEDNKGGKSSEVSRTIKVDKTAPKTPSLNLVESWTSGNRTFTITGGADNTGGSGLDRLEYKIGNGAWTRYSSTVTALSSSGTVQVQARAIDKVGNISPVATKTARVDKIKPTATITNNDDNWHSDNITVNIKHSDDGGSGVKTKQYTITNSSTEPSTGWINLISEEQDVIVSDNGNNYVHVKIIDNANNETYSYKGPFKVDKTPPDILRPNVSAILPSPYQDDLLEIEIDTTKTLDNESGLPNNPVTIYRRRDDEEDSAKLTDWTSTIYLDDSNLDANMMYYYKYKARDIAGNISEFSEEVGIYTKALNPVEAIVEQITEDSITLTIINAGDNSYDPYTMISLKEKGTNKEVANSGWSQEETNRKVEGLTAGKEYEVYVNTKNGDEKIFNGEFKIPLKDKEGNDIDSITTIKPVKNFEVINSTINSLEVKWDKTEGQQYQLWLLDENKKEIPNSESVWIDNNCYTFENLNLKPNTKYIPYIITKHENTQLHIGPYKIDEKRAYTDAQSVYNGIFEPGETSITIKLDVDNSGNPADTEYEIRNDITGIYTKVHHNKPEWDDTGLAQESYYTYSVKTINKNEKESNYFKLIFANGEEPHTKMPDLEIPEFIDKEEIDYIDLDLLKTWDANIAIDSDYFIPTELNNKYVKLEDKIYFTTKEKFVEISNTNKISAQNYAFSRDGFGYTTWKTLEDGYFKENIDFNIPGKYEVHFKFKNYIVESEPIKANYFADWVEPTIEGEPAIKGQSAVTGSGFKVNIKAEDNISPYLFYSTDDGETWFLLEEGQDEIEFTNIEKTSNGKQNKLTIKIADICGNVAEKTFTVWGISQ